MRVGLCAVLIGLMLVSVSLLGCRVRGSSRDRPDRDGKVSWRSSGSERKPPEKLPRGARTLFERNGFVVLGRQESRSIKDGYFTVLGRNFITSDAVLYVFHCLFRGGLSRYEKDRLTPLLEGLTGKCLAHAREERDRLRADPLLSEPARRNVVLFAVASELLTGQAVPDERSDVAALVTDILAADKPGYYPAEDFTVYKPRGAYASDPRLASYFRATKWLGRHIMPIIPGALDTEPEASIRLRQAHLLGKMLQDPELAGLWRKLEGELSFLITYPDSITPLQFAAATAGIPGPCDGAWVAAVRREFALAKYPDSAVVPIPQAHPGDAPAKYVQFLGERYTPDAQIHQEATSPHIAARALPRALDIGYALFGSERCREHLAPEFEAYPGLADQLDILQKRFGGWGAGKTPGSVYAGWVGAIREVISPPSSPKLPPFLATEAWKDKSLTTALASWTQMRHDFVLYAKEPVTPAAAGIEWFVEPVPEA
ncbi:MAG: DUF3160 domain-containing protein [Armatimonadetes bacterium]|nr:DUF3160 domain-containing protein [Armatimonadota bacterium]